MRFAQFCQWLSNHAGRPSTFLVAIVLIGLWAASGPWFHYNDTWQLIINTSTTIITFLMVFLIQNTQNRDNDMIHVKLDELIRATRSAERSVLDLEAMDSKELRTLRREYRAMAEGCDQATSLDPDKSSGGLDEHPNGPRKMPNDGTSV